VQIQNRLKRAFAVSAGIASSLLFPVQALAVDIITQDVRPDKGYATDFGKLLNFLLQIVMVIAVLLVFLYLILGGIEWITSGGEKSKTEAARNKITSAVIGLIILAASYAILTLLLKFLGFGDLKSALNGITPINQ
jgi:hypothetical protein